MINLGDVAEFVGTLLSCFAVFFGLRILIAKTGVEPVRSGWWALLVSTVFTLLITVYGAHSAVPHQTGPLTYWLTFHFPSLLIWFTVYRFHLHLRKS